MTLTGPFLGLMLSLGLLLATGSPYNWMLIGKADTSMISVFLTLWTTGKRNFTFYSAPTPAGSYCILYQVEP